MNWLEPESVLLGIAGGDVEKGGELVRATLAYMREHGLSYKNLSSLVNVARTVWDKKQSPGNGNGAAPWSLIERAWKEGNARVILEDARVVTAVERMGGWPRFKSAEEREIPFLKREFMKVYDATT